MITERAVRMTTTAVAAAMVILGIGVERAHAQDGEFTGKWIWEVTTDDGDAVVEPGETAAVTLLMDLEPSVGEPGPTEGLVVTGFAGGIFDVLGGANAAKGEIVGWEIPKILLTGTGDLTETDGVSLFGVNVSQGVGVQTIDPADPIEVVAFQWTTDAFSSYTVEYTTESVLAAWEGVFPKETLNSFLVEPVEGTIAFDVVPAPPTTIGLLGGLVLLRQGRRRFVSPALVVAACAASCHAQQNPGGTVRVVEGESLLSSEIAFESLNLADITQTSKPPDPVIAASADFLVVVTNNVIATYRRSDLADPAIQPMECMTLKDFFGDTADPIDPRVVYDHNSGRFVASAFRVQFGPAATMYLRYTGANPDLDPGETSLTEWTPATHVGGFTDMGCEGGSNPGENMALDQPGLGYDAEAWYVSAPLAEPIPTHGTPVSLDSVIWVIPKPETDPPPPDSYVVRCRDFEDEAGQALGCLDLDVHEGGIQAPRPAEAMGAPPAAYFVGFSDFCDCCDDADPCDDDVFDHLRIYAIASPLGGSPDLRFFELPVPQFEVRLEGGMPVSVPAVVPTGEVFFTIDARIQNACWREVVPVGGGTAEGMLYATHTINSPVEVMDQGVPAEADRSVVRWYRIRTNGWPVSPGETPELADWGEVEEANVDFDADGDGSDDSTGPVHLFMPSVCVNVFGDMALVMHRASRVHPLSVIATARYVDTPAGETLLPHLLIRESDHPGEPKQGNGAEGVGDYTDIALDPFLETWWVIGEHMRTSCDPSCTTPCSPDPCIESPCLATYAAEIELAQDGN